MTTTYVRHVVAGAAVLDMLAAERAALVPTCRSGHLNSEDLCAWQRNVSRRGILGAELVLSNYGWSVRYNSGLQNWGLIASSRHGQVDGTLEAAEAFARVWVAGDPSRRYCTRTEAMEVAA